MIESDWTPTKGERPFFSAIFLCPPSVLPCVKTLLFVRVSVFLSGVQLLVLISLLMLVFLHFANLSGSKWKVPWTTKLFWIFMAWEAWVSVINSITAGPKNSLSFLVVDGVLRSYRIFSSSISLFVFMQGKNSNLSALCIREHSFLAFLLSPPRDTAKIKCHRVGVSRLLLDLLQLASTIIMTLSVLEN